MSESLPIALRCYTKPKSNKKKGLESNNTQESNHAQNTSYRLPDREMFIDTETDIELKQTLKFGCCKTYNHNKFEYEYLLYNPDNINKTELKTLQNYSKVHRIKLIKIQDFIEDIFYPEVHTLKTLLVGFNLPFDLSRMAKSFCSARYEYNAFSVELSNKKEHPRIIINHRNKNQSFINFNSTYYHGIGKVPYERDEHTFFPGYFLDLKTLVFTLTNESLSLKDACELFNTDVKKTKAEGHGRITPEYIDYCIRDVEATHSLYLKLKEEYKEYDLDVPINKLYSPASLGKGYLKKLNIRPFLEQNPDFPLEILGKVMTTYSGGRSEVRIRKQITQVNVKDFKSMYPTVCTLQNLWKFIIADKVEYIDDTENVKKFVEYITLGDLQNPETWKKFNCMVRILPDNNILPVRSKYGNKNAYNIGVNYLTSTIPLWYALSDVVVSKLLTGKTPTILEAVRFEPVGVQKSLRTIKLIGDKAFNPYEEDLFKILIEYRQEIQNKRDTYPHGSKKYNYYENLQNIIKIISNATSYGIFVELNPNKKKYKIDLDVFGLDEFSTKKKFIEKPGKMFNPVVSILITSGAKLILGITEKLLKDNDSYYTFCDTDSMAVEPRMIETIQEFFQYLNPYNFDTDLFKLEPYNYKPEDWKDLNEPNTNIEKIKITNELEPLYCYPISTKRYCLFNLKDGKPILRKYTSHGLGSYMNPFYNSKDQYWHKEIWQDILNEVYNLSTPEDIYWKYEGLYAISQHSVTSPHLMNYFNRLNKNKPYTDQIKPFNFMIVGTSNTNAPHSNKFVQPIAPFTKYPQSAPDEEFINRISGEILKGNKYWKSFLSVYEDFKNHKEKKFDGDIGLLERKHIVVSSMNQIKYIGKEAKNIEEVRVMGIDKNSVETYIPANKENEYSDNEKYNNLVLKINNDLAEKFGISIKQLYNWRRLIKNNKTPKYSDKSIAKLNLLFEIDSHHNRNDQYISLILGLTHEICKNIELSKREWNRLKAKIKCGSPLNLSSKIRYKLSFLTNISPIPHT